MAAVNSRTSKGQDLLNAENDFDKKKINGRNNRKMVVSLPVFSILSDSYVFDWDNFCLGTGKH